MKRTALIFMAMWFILKTRSSDEVTWLLNQLPPEQARSAKVIVPTEAQAEQWKYIVYYESQKEIKK